jgi:ATP-dependent DNA helicase RecG
MLFKAKVKDFDITYLPLIGTKRSEVLKKKGFLNVMDLARYFPKSYILRESGSNLKKLTTELKQRNTNLDLKVGIENIKYLLKSEISIIARIIEKRLINTKSRKSFLKLTITDDTNYKASITFFNFAEYYNKIYNLGDNIVVSGYPEINEYGINFQHPNIELIDLEDLELYKKDQIISQYTLPEELKKAGINNKVFRKIINEIKQRNLVEIEETLPLYIINEHNFFNQNDSFWGIHQPESIEKLNKYKLRLKYEELLYYQLKLNLEKKINKIIEIAPKINIKSKLARELYEKLPFELTKDQKKVLKEIDLDLKSGNSMNRLLQGDVGSGKTIVAILASLMVIDNGYQVVLMAPTEILAEQHYKTFTKYIDLLSLKVDLLTGSLKEKDKKLVYARIKSGETRFIIGTHSLFQEKLEYNKLGLLIIDEQHRFGVEQRAELKRLAIESLGGTLYPHTLVMSATPIPRTITMSVYGELDISIIKTKPSNRQEITTKVWYESKINTVYDFVIEELIKERQAYIIYPLVEISEKIDLKSLEEHYEVLAKDIFKNYKCGLLHGKMNWKEKEEAMRKFANKDYDVLIATTVVEVGIDVPNANIMIIENAERFGLSQLHQLRGRVGRGSEKSYCFLITKDNFQFKMKSKKEDLIEENAAIIRLKTMESTNDGFQIAEVDLKLRGPGDILGTKQSGLPAFEFASLTEDENLLINCNIKAKEIISEDSNLILDKNSILKEVLKSKENKSYFGIA